MYMRGVIRRARRQTKTSIGEKEKERKTRLKMKKPVEADRREWYNGRSD